MVRGTALRDIERGTVLAGKLRVERVLGRGAMGVVFEATDLALHRRVAVKVVGQSLGNTPETRERFTREARAAAKLASDHVARVFETGELDDGAPYLVMEYLEGRSLEAVVTEDGPLDPAFAIDCMLQALEALAEAHRAGLVHRDFKPANLFLAERPNGRSVVKVLDFGIVKDAASKARITETGAVMGTPAYMSPEQITSGAPVDARADVWAAGVSLFELVVGTLPFDASSIPGMLSRILREDAPRLRQLRPDLPEDLEGVVARCLDKDPGARFADAAELAAALEQVRARLASTTSVTKTIRMPPGFSLLDALAETQAVEAAPLTPASPSAAAPAVVPTPRSQAATVRTRKRTPNLWLFATVALAVVEVGVLSVGLALFFRGAPAGTANGPRLAASAPGEHEPDASEGEGSDAGPADDATAATAEEAVVAPDASAVEAGAPVVPATSSQPPRRQTAHVAFEVSGGQESDVAWNKKAAAWVASHRGQLEACFAATTCEGRLTLTIGTDPVHTVWHQAPAGRRCVGAQSIECARRIAKTAPRLSCARECTRHITLVVTREP